MPNISFGSRLRHAFNVIRYGESNQTYGTRNLGPSYSIRPDLYRLSVGVDTSFISSIYTRIGIDVASIPIQHVRLDENQRYVETINSGLNNCLTLEANIDQTGRAFIQDIVMSMCDEGVVAVVPVDTTMNPAVTGSYDIVTMRTAKIVAWYPKHVRVNIYNDETGYKQDITLPKTMVAIIENPLFAVMNEPNSTLQRLMMKLNLLDVIDQQSGSGKLDLIIQLPYVIKTEARRQQAEIRRQAIEEQLQGSKYGIAYTDGTERITQLNRPAENNLMKQIEYLTSMLYSQLGLTQAVFDGTADEKEMINYYNRSIEPILAAVVNGMKRVFITKTGRTQGQSIEALRDPFKLVPISQIADVADKFSRNAILSSNELRQIVGRKPSNDANADILSNKNLNQPPIPGQQPQTESEPTSSESTSEGSISIMDMIKKSEGV